MAKRFQALKTGAGVMQDMSARVKREAIAADHLRHTPVCTIKPSDRHFRHENGTECSSHEYILKKLEQMNCWVKPDKEPSIVIIPIPKGNCLAPYKRKFKWRLWLYTIDWYDGGSFGE